jgi:hypothetical protein
MLLLFHVLPIHMYTLLMQSTICDLHTGHSGCLLDSKTLAVHSAHMATCLHGSTKVFLGADKHTMQVNKSSDEKVCSALQGSGRGGVVVLVLLWWWWWSRVLEHAAGCKSRPPFPELRPPFPDACSLESAVTERSTASCSVSMAAAFSAACTSLSRCGYLEHWP